MYSVPDCGVSGDAALDWVGDEIVAERNGDGTLARRHVHGDGVDDPLVTYEGAGTSDRRWLHADERGSIVALSDAAGMPLAYNRYDEYGRAASITGRFGYTGQAWLPQVGLYTYKARMYAPGLGRFMQADPIGYGDGLNMFGYVGADPVNLSDPSGRYADASICSLNPTICAKVSNPPPVTGEDIVVSACPWWKVGVPPNCEDPRKAERYRDHTLVLPDMRAERGGGMDRGPEEETVEQRRKLLAEEDTKRRARNAYCAAIRLDGMRNGALKGILFGAFASSVDLAEDRARKLSVRNVLKSILSKGSIAGGIASSIWDGHDAVSSDPICRNMN